MSRGVNVTLGTDGASSNNNQDYTGTGTGGIVSAAVDGVRAAEAVMARWAPPKD